MSSLFPTWKGVRGKVMGRVSRPGGERLLWMPVVARQRANFQAREGIRELLLLGEAQVLGARETRRVLNLGQKKKEAGAPAGLRWTLHRGGSRPGPGRVLRLALQPGLLLPLESGFHLAEGWE